MMSLRLTKLLAGVLMFVFVFSGFVSAQSLKVPRVQEDMNIPKIPLKGYATDEVVHIYGQNVHAIVYNPGLEDLRVGSLYQFAKKNGVNMSAFFHYLSEYVWKHGLVTFEDVRYLLIDFANKSGMDLVKLAEKDGVDLNFTDLIRNPPKDALKPQIVDVIDQVPTPLTGLSVASTSDCGNNPDNIYDYYGNMIVDATCDPATFHFDDAGYFIGTYASAKVGSYWYIFAFNFTNYKSPSELKNWILNVLKNNYSISPNRVELVHMKYFIQGYAPWMKKYSVTVHFDNAPVQDYILFELWSEATYYTSTDTWVKYGYPDSDMGGLFIILNKRIKTLAGFAMRDYTPYPIVSQRIISSDITHIDLTIYSTIWHQQRLEGVGDWW